MDVFVFCKNNFEVGLVLNAPLLARQGFRCLASALAAQTLVVGVVLPPELERSERLPCMAP